MRTVRRIAKNTGIFLASQVISSVLSFFFFAYSARYLGAENFGVFSFAIALGAIFSIFSELGLGQVVTREVARDKSLASKYLGNVFGIKIILTVLTFGGLAIFANLAGYSKETITVVYLIGLAIVFRAFTLLFSSIFQAHEKMEYDSAGQIINNGLLFFGVFFAISQKLDVIGFACIYLFANATTSFYYLLVCVLKFYKFKVEIDWPFAKRTINEALPFALSSVFTVILNWIDTVMLSTMKGEAVTGWYNAAYRIIFVLLFIPYALNAAIFPIMSRLHNSSTIDLKMIYERSLKYFIIIGIPMGVGGTLLAERIILFVFTSQYQPAVIAFQILIWSAVLMFVGSSFNNLFSSTNKQNMLMKIVAASTVLNILLNLILIPKYSYTGSAVATVISMLFMIVASVLGAAKIGYNLPVAKNVSTIVKATAASFVMAIFTVFLKDANLFFLIAFSAIIYFIMIYFLMAFDKEDFILFKKIIK